jgi:hypothetical protein
MKNDGLGGMAERVFSVEEASVSIDGTAEKVREHIKHR